MNSIENKLKEVFSNIFKISVKKINKKTNFKNLKKWDSLNHVKLIIAIESEFKLSINPDDSLNFLSFGIILKYLKKKKNYFKR
jgi:acyl carrier protein